MKRNRFHMLCWILVLWVGFGPPALLFSRGKPVKMHPVTYGKKYLRTYRQRYSVTKSPPEIKPGDLHPLVSLYDEPFHYNYDLTAGTPLQTLPVSLGYEVSGGENGVGIGWTLVYTFQLSRAAPVNIVSPEISYHRNNSGEFLYVNSEAIPVQSAQENGREVLVSKKEYHGLRYSFLKAGIKRGYLILPYKIQAKTGEPVIFKYSPGDPEPVLSHIYRGRYRLQFFYKEGPSGPLARVELGVKTVIGGEIVKYWLFSYETAGVRHERFLRHIAIHDGEHGENALRFSYGIFDQDKITAGEQEQVDWYSPGAEPGCVWKLQESSRWLLPGGKTIKNNPGLRFIKLNQRDPHLDLVETGTPSTDSWKWDPESGKWKHFGDTYKPDRPSVHYRYKPTGSHFINLWKSFKDDRFNTTKHQALITAYYKPTRDKRGLEYHYEVCFPKVFLDELDPDGSGTIWERVTDERLKLPVPLQYEGTPWPTHIPGISAEEAFTNQGAQFVGFPQNGLINLLYIGKRYRDAVTNEILLRDIVTHRDTCNCREWKEEEWEQKGVKKRVKVDLCQGFWTAIKEYWSDDLFPGTGSCLGKKYPVPGESFWERKDLDPAKQPLDCFILPWQDLNPDYYHHYMGFRNVRFVSLDCNKIFMIVHAPEPMNPGGPVKDIYRFRRSRWIKEEKGSGYYPPDEIFDKKECMFVDLDNDGRDDLIIPRGPGRDTFINMGKNIKPRWQRCPAFRIPTECDLVDGARFVDLDVNGAQDLIFGNGARVFMNQSISGNGPSNRMTVFTDEFGKQRQVKDIE